MTSLYFTPPGLVSASQFFTAYSLYLTPHPNIKHVTFLLSSHFLSIDLSANGPETDSLITSNMAPMFPAFKGESVMLRVKGSWISSWTHR